MYMNRNKGALLVEFSIAVALVSILLLPLMRYSGSLMKLKRGEKMGYREEIRGFEKISKMEYGELENHGKNIEEKNEEVKVLSVVIKGIGMEGEREGFLVEKREESLRRVRIDPGGISHCL